MKKIALKIAYIGTNFFGSQRQKIIKTIDREIINCLISLKIIKDEKVNCYQSCCRTDSGVHAMTYIVSFYVEYIRNIPYSRIINSKLKDDIWIYSHAFVSDDFNPRYDAINREYLYILNNNDYDLELMISISKLFIGSHDFYNFSKIDKKNKLKSTIRTISNIEINKVNEQICIKIQANSFLWKMVRKIVYCLAEVGSKRKDKQWILNLLNPIKYKEYLKCMPADGLILININYKKRIQWINDNYSIVKMKKKILKNIDENMIKNQVFIQLYESIN